VYADDVEAVLQAHPEVVEAAVVGIPHEVLGEDIAAFVVLRPGSTVSTGDLQAFAGERWPTTRCPPRQLPGGTAQERRRQGAEIGAGRGGRRPGRPMIHEGHHEQRRGCAGPPI